MKPTNPIKTFLFSFFLFMLLTNPLKVNCQITNDKTTESTMTIGKVILPKLTVKERNAITKPEEGMVIYNKEAKKPQFYNGTAWKFFDMNHHFIGESFGGGIVFYIDASGDHGLIVANSDQSTAAEWGLFDKQIGAIDLGVGKGKENTDKIKNATSNSNIAATICSNLKHNGFNDWFLPSLDELILIYENLKLKDLGNFSDDDYWSSSETDFNNAWQYNFSKGISNEAHVNKAVRVRAVRAF